MIEPYYLPADSALRASFDTIIDVRSPAEFALDHFPGAINLPVLDDAQRAEIGTLYKQVSPFVARKRGAALVSSAIAAHLENSLADKPREWRPLIYCWRGGQRSASMAIVLAQVGWKVTVLEGGYHAYRKAMVPLLAELLGKLNLQVLCAETGSGKSRLLQALFQAGHQTLDLEGIARHRGSVLGLHLDEAQPSQKRFESSLFSKVLSLDPTREVWVESESVRIGALRVPAELINRMHSAPCYILQTPLELRVDLLLDEYVHFTRDPASLEKQLDCLRSLHGAQTITEWKQLIQEKKWREFVAAILSDHYDPSYRRSMPRNFSGYADAIPVEITGTNPNDFMDAALRLGSLQEKRQKFPETMHTVESEQ
jgi:tRNA 2-selenouridine synthase